MAEMNFAEKLLVNSRIYNFFYRTFTLNKFLNFCRLEGKCLEIGCGAGFTSRELAKKFKIALTATDYDREQIKEAQKRLGGTGIRVMQADATALPFKDGTFDCVVEMNTFHHISEYKKAIEETRRVLKKGGRFFIMDVSRYFLWPLGLFLPFEHFDGKFTRDSMMKDLEDAGFKVIRHRRKGIFMIECRKL